MIYSDIEFSRKLERTEARANVDFVDTRARLDPASGSEWIDVGGTYAMFDGVGSPLTQTFGLGLFDEVTNESLEILERFFTERDAEVFHEVSPMADAQLLGILAGRSYHPIELTSVMYLELDKIEPILESKFQIRIADESDADIWAATAAAGWAAEFEGIEEFILGIGKISARTKGSRPFLAELDGQIVATGSLGIYDNICILAGAATLPTERRQGAQNALLSARLDHARKNGCELAMICATPGSQSQKNAQRNGFKIAYTRIKWLLKN